MGLVYALCVEWDQLRAGMDNSIVLYVFVVVVNTGKSHVSDGELDRAIEQGRAAAMEIFNEVSVKRRSYRVWPHQWKVGGKGAAVVCS